MGQRHIRKYTLAIMFIVLPLCGIAAILYTNLHAEAISDKGLVINEIVAKNLSGLKTPEGKTSDWIELYNSGKGAINLSDYFLTNSLNKKDKMNLPEYMMNPGQYLILFADGEEGIDEQGNIHVNFALNSDGGRIALYQNGELVDLIEYPEQQFDLSYGKKINDLNQCGFFPYTTPGKSNPVEFLASAQQTQADWGPVSFSNKGGFYKTDLELSLWSDEPDAQIVYTLDGSEPTIDSSVYKEPIKLSERTDERNRYTTVPCMADKQYGVYNIGLEYGINSVFKSTVVRARILKDGILGSEITTNTYFINAVYSMPVVSLSVNAEEMFDETNGIYTIGVWAEQLKHLGNNSFWQYGNYMVDKAIDSHMEYYDANGNCLFETSGQLKLNGGWSAAFSQQKSLKFSWDEAKSLPGILNEEYQYTALKLKGPGGGEIYPTLYQDVYVQNLIYDENVGTYKGDFAIVFINGEYWGIYAVVEPKDRTYFMNHYHADEVECMYPGNWSNILAVRYGTESTLNEFAELYAEMVKRDFQTEENYSWIQTKVDLQSFINTVAAESFFCNMDGLRYGDHNMYMWRSTKKNDSNEYEDGRWRWMIYDFDAAMNTINEPYMDENTLEELLNFQVNDNTNFTVTLFQKLWENMAFRKLFCEEYITKLDTIYSCENLTSAFDCHVNQLETEMEENLSRLEIGKNLYYDWTAEEGASFDWYFNSTMDEFYRDKDLVNQWLLQRTDVMRGYLEQYMKEIADEPGK